ncbi:MAG: hypothetical protein V1742_06810 [Pseudomonadota bacterium]
MRTAVVMITALYAAVWSVLWSPSLTQASETWNCRTCHPGRELTGREMVPIWDYRLGRPMFEPCPGRRRVMREIFLTEIRMVSLEGYLGQAGGRASDPDGFFSELDKIKSRYYNLLAEPLLSADDFAARAHKLRQHLDERVFRPADEKRRIKRLVAGALILAAVLIGIGVLVRVRYLPLRRKLQARSRNLTEEAINRSGREAGLDQTGPGSFQD